MSELARFKIGDLLFKARIFAAGSRKSVCKVCGEPVGCYKGLLLRFQNPRKEDATVCHVCLVKLAKQMMTISEKEGTPNVRNVSRKLSLKVNNDDTEVEDAED